jgi:hypothetical protein
MASTLPGFRTIRVVIASARACSQRFQDLESCGDDLDADAIAGDGCNPVFPHACDPFENRRPPSACGEQFV